MESMKCLKYAPIVSIIVLFTLLNCLYFIVGLSKAPSGTIFTGAVYYAPDYYFYLSQISQGATRWLSNFPLFTGEITVPQYIGWFYTLSGHLLLPLAGATNIFFLLTISTTVLYLLVAYILIRQLLPRPTRLWAFLLFLTANTMPRIFQDHGVWKYLYTSGWYNFGNPFERLTYIPHHMLFEAAAMAAIIFIAKSRKYILLYILIGIILSSMQPALWMVVTIGLALGGLWRPNKLLPSLLPACIVGLSGVPFVLYLKYYLYTFPFYSNQLVSEPSWTIAFGPKDYLLFNGPLVITAILGLPSWIRSMTREKFTLTAITVVSLLLFFSPVGNYIQILNIRFLSVIPTLFYAVVTVAWLTRFKRTSLIIITLLIISTIPLMIQELVSRHVLNYPNNVFVYVPRDVYSAYTEASKISDPDNVFLVFPPYDTAFVGIAGRRVFAYWGATGWTINFQEKNTKADAFYHNQMTDDEKAIFLRTYRISYVLWNTSKQSPYTSLVPVYTNPAMTIYKVPVLQ